MFVVIMRALRGIVVGLFLIVPLAGCLGGGDVDEGPDPTQDAPELGYLPEDPDPDLELVETDEFLTGFEGTEIHVRVKRPAGDGPFPVIVQFTPYTAPGENVIVNQLAEPLVDCENVQGVPVNCEGRFDHEFVRRGYAFVYGDARGTGDSSGCLDLRGNNDIADLGELTAWAGEQSWSNGNVGYIGGSYPGSMAHMAGIANDPALKAIVPVVASTSFYHYHHNGGGVPYAGQHSLGGTNTGYTTNALMPTVNPQNTNYLLRYIEEVAMCGAHENVLDHGGLDQSGAYYDWWQERNLRPRAGEVQVPVLMAQGLADWNVKPDHIADWFNDLQVQSKTMILGQWGHAYPYGVCEDEPTNFCDPQAPYGDWWQYVTSFFDTFLKEVDTGMFQDPLVWAQDSTGGWHRSAVWPVPDDEREKRVFHLHANGTLMPDARADQGEARWYGCPDDQGTYGVGELRQLNEDAGQECEPEGVEELVFESEPFGEDAIVSGVPKVRLTLESEAEVTHLVALVELLDQDGEVVNRQVRVDAELGTRENYGYSNPVYRDGLENPQDLPTGEAYEVTIRLFPQEDVILKGERLRLRLSSDDGGRSIEAYEPGWNTLLFSPETVNSLELPLRPAALQGTRLS